MPATETFLLRTLINKFDKKYMLDKIKEDLKKDETM